IALSATPGTVVESGSSSCPWAQQLSVQEKSGFSVLLTQFVAGGVNLSGSISKIFGTTRLAPFGTLQGTFCSSGLTPPVNQSFTLTGSANAGPVTASVTSGFLGPSSAPAALDATPTSV